MVYDFFSNLGKTTHYKIFLRVLLAIFDFFAKFCFSLK